MNIDYIKEYVKNNLSKNRLYHTYGVCDTALKLSSLYGCDQRKAEIAALSHDIFRGKSMEEINKYVIELGLDKNRYINNPNLAHGKIAKEIVEKKFGIKDKDILNAISYHTTGRKNMSLLEKIIFISDAIEPGRNYPGVELIRKEAYINLDKSCYLSLIGTYNNLIKQNIKVDKDTLEAINFFKETMESING